MPASLSGLPIVEAIDAETDLFDSKNVIIYDPYVYEWLAPAGKAGKAATSRERYARAADYDAYGCLDNAFCLYDQDNWQPPGIVIWHGYNGAGWLSLGDYYNFNDRAQSMRNRRENDSRLSKNNPATFGANDLYCADSHSSDTDFTNNFGGPPFPGCQRR